MEWPPSLLLPSCLSEGPTSLTEGNGTERNGTDHAPFPSHTPRMASSSSSSTHKNRSTVSTLFFLTLSLLSIFIFIFFFFFFFFKTRDPALSLHADLVLHPPPLSLPLSSPTHIHNNTQTQQLIQQPEPEPVEQEPATDTRNNTQTQQPEPVEAEPATDTKISLDDDEQTVQASQTQTVLVDDANDNDNVTNNGDSDGDDVALKQQLECDWYRGTWVKDEENYPIYQPGSCPYVDEAYDCQINGRTDSEYTKWRWKPDGCDLPRFSAADFLVRLRGKRLMLVGDSMNRNQFESILCILREGLQNKSKMYETHGYKITKGRGYFVFKFEDYNCTVEFVRSHFLVREGVRINGQGSSNPTLSIDRIDKTSRRWKRADILIFNTGHWWTHGKTARGINYYKEGDYLYPKFDAVEAYRRAIKTWAKWIDDNINPRKQIVYYRGYSSAHFRGGDWDSGGSCYGETEPVYNGTILDNYPLKMKIVEEVIQGMKVPVKLLNVTRLTNFRKDGHPSVYGKSTMAGNKVSTRRQDCSHWCLPGVPDAWNELIYATLVFHQTNSRS